MQAGEICDGIVTKCLGAPKTKTKELAGQVILMLCEIEAHERVVEELIKGLAQKNPKGPFINDVYTIFGFIDPLPSLCPKNLFVRKCEVFLDPPLSCVDVISKLPQRWWPAPWPT